MKRDDMTPGAPLGQPSRPGEDAPSNPQGARDIGAALTPPKPGEAPQPGHALKPPERPAEQPTQTKLPSFTMSAAKPPSLSLPKGGGAMRPLGETFKTNPSTGTGSYAIPIAAPEARGFSPGLSLQYDSGSGNGIFGLGWSLSLGSITRSTSKRLPEYRDAEESDIFVLSGAEELVPARKLDQGAWVDDTADTATHHVLRYRPRTEGAFSRIERWTHRETRETHWVVTTGANVKTFCGRTAASRIADPDNAQRVFSWLVDRVQDDRGNVLEVAYAAEDLENVPRPSRHEMHRQDGLVSITNNRYPKRIRYGNTVMHAATLFPDPPAAVPAVFEVVFDYGEHDTDAPSPDAAPGVRWACRQDPFSSYRAGFEVRTYRLCRRILVFHRFEELGTEPCLVKSFDLAYDADPALTRLRSVTAAGYTKAGDTYSKSTLPPLEFGYSLPTRVPETLPMSADSIADVDVGSIGKKSQWVDLDGEGLPGILTREGGGFRYHRNLSGGKLARGRPIRTEPSLGAEGAQIVDLDGSGIPSLVSFEGKPAGTFLREGDDWGSFRPFREVPNVGWQSAQVKHVDLNGDGRDDLLVVTRDAYVWYPSLGRDGYGEPRWTPRTEHDNELPGPPFYASQFGAALLADMTGDGLPDLVHVTGSQVQYWPNLGHGKFGKVVVMTRSPKLGRPDEFDGGRVRFADLDGSGTADLLYFDGDGLRIYWNQAGNSFHPEPTRVAGYPTEEGLRTLALMDVLGRGTTQIVYAPANTRGPGPALRVIDVVGAVKPYLLTSVDNHVGLTTKVQYAPSTQFYLADRAAGRPWATKLPFPVQVVEKVEVYDAVRRHRFTQEYTYHHGAYDPDEREFRGFGRVETRDTDWTSESQGKGLFPERPPAVNHETPQPPVLTKTWYHLGIPRFDAALTKAYRAEQWTPTTPLLLAGPVLPPGLTLAERHDALRAMRGQVLRTEVYGLDGAPQDGIPVQVTESRVRVRKIQPPRGGAGATGMRSVCFAHAEEALSVHYEKDDSDPRVSHHLTLDVDDFGVVTKEAFVAYGRTAAGAEPEQQSRKIAVAEHVVKHLPADSMQLRLAVPLQERLWELRRDTAPASGALYTNAEIVTAFEAAGEAAYEQTAADGQKRKLAHVVHRYYNSLALPALLAEGSADLMALPYESYAQAFTEGLLGVTFESGHAVNGTLLASAGYQDRTSTGDGWWTRSGQQVLDAAHFYLPSRVIDPFGQSTTMGYDDHDLFVTTVTAPLGTVVSAQLDYRVLSPAQITDPNGNRTQAAFDDLGRVTKTAVMGKVGSSDGDTLAAPTVQHTYDLGRYDTDGKPAFVKTEARERHGEESWLTSYAFYDGTGAVALSKVQAEPDGLTARWVGSGRTVLNNKGNPVKQYEPYFSPSWDWEAEEALEAVGVTPIFSYDALGRLVRTELPNGTFRRVRFTPWRMEAWDENDTVSDAGNLWYAARQPNAVPTPSVEEQRAATRTWGHRQTPTVTCFDNLGRAFLVQQFLEVFEPPPDPSKIVETRSVLDIEGQVLEVKDALNRPCMRYTYAVDGQVLKQRSIDAGDKWSLANVIGTPFRAWDAVGHRTRVEVDELQRPVRVWVQKGAGAEGLATRVYYGESFPSPETANLRGQTVLTFDGAGLVETASFDFKGNALTWARTLATAYATEPDWTAIATEDAADAKAAATSASLLQSETWQKAFAYDALNRVTSATMPDGSELLPSYNEAGLLDGVEGKIRGAATATSFVDDIEYDAHGRRTRIAYSNNTVTEYSHDEQTFRLTRIRTTRSTDSKVLQDLKYTYDPVGNIVEVRDDAHEDVFYNDAQVEPTGQFVYDAIYRLVGASGREHASGVGDVQRDQNDLPLWELPHPNNAAALRRYNEEYTYDKVGNLLEFFHEGVNGPPGATWTRTYRFDTGLTSGYQNNRLHSTSEPGPAWASYTHDANGNMTAMPHLASIEYTHRDQMRHVDLGGGGDAYYTYDAGGERVRKLIQRTGTTTEERIYLGGWELYRRRSGAGQTIEMERETLHVMGDTRRIAMVETLTVDGGNVVSTPVPRLRYQYGNHLESAMLECDAAGDVISYEEYHPYGTAAYRSARSGVEVSVKRYRYTGKERDEETALDYFGARYYVPWTGRWSTTDPAGIVDSAALYTYAACNPATFRDPDGRELPKPGTVNYTIMTKTDSQLFAYMKALEKQSPAALGAFLAQSSGAFQVRASAMRAKYPMKIEQPSPPTKTPAPNKAPEDTFSSPRFLDALKGAQASLGGLGIQSKVLDKAVADAEIGKLHLSVLTTEDPTGGRYEPSTSAILLREHTWQSLETFGNGGVNEENVGAVGVAVDATVHEGTHHYERTTEEGQAMRKQVMDDAIARGVSLSAYGRIALRIGDDSPLTKAQQQTLAYRYADEVIADATGAAVRHDLLQRLKDAVIAVDVSSDPKHPTDESGRPANHEFGYARVWPGEFGQKVIVDFRARSQPRPLVFQFASQLAHSQ